MRSFVRKWFRSLPWVLLACAAVCCAMAVYTWRLEPDCYRSSAVLYAAPRQDTTFAVRMLVSDCRSYVSTDEFARGIELSETISLDVTAEEGSHLIQLIAEGPDVQEVFEAANRAANALQIALETVLQAQNTAVIQLPQLPEAPIGPNRMARLFWTWMISFAAASVVGGWLGKDPKKLCFDDPEAENVSLGALAETGRDCARFQKNISKAANGGTLLQHVNRITRESVQKSALQLRCAMDRTNAKVLALVPVSLDDENAAASVLMAQELAQKGFRVLLMEMDASRPLLRTALCEKARADLPDFWQHRAELDEVVVKTAAARLSFIDWLHPDISPAELTATEAFSAFLNSAKDHFDYVLLQTPALNREAGAAMLALAADEAVLVIRSKRHTAEAVWKAADVLRRLDQPALGVLFTGVKRWQLETEE